MLMVDPESRRVQAADPDQAFREGNCLAVEVAPNRDGDLYVFNHGSSGDWQLLMPSPLMPGEPTSVKASQLVRLPADHCFILDNQPGVETLVLVVTELKEDVQSIRALLGAQGDGSNATSPPVLTPVTTAANLSSVRAKIEAWQQLASRDMGIQKLAQPQSAGERPFSVYAVNSSAAEAGRLVIEIKIRHE